MKRSVGAMILAAAAGGCLSSNPDPKASTQPVVRASGQTVPLKVPGLSGPWGEPIPMSAPYTASPPMNAYQAKNMMYQSVPLNWMQTGAGVQQASMQMPGMGYPAGMPMMPPAGMLSPPGVPMMPALMPPGGMMPGMPPVPGGKGGMPMPGMAKGGMPPGMLMPAAFSPAGAVAAVGAMTNQGGGAAYALGRTQVRFSGPESMRIAWLTQGADGKPTYSATVVETPGRYNFNQASIYRLKLSGVRGRPGLELYPTLEVVPANPKTGAFLAHSAVPIEFTAEDFQEVTEGKYLVKVIYLPDPQYQEIAAMGTDQIISTRLEPGADPILEAQRRGCILLVIRMGNVDQEAPNTPPLDCTSPVPSPPATSVTPNMPMTGPSAFPGAAAPSPSMPPALQGGPSLPGPMKGNSMPPLPGLPGATPPSVGPSLGGSASKAPSVPATQPMSGITPIPDLPSLPPSGLDAPPAPMPSEPPLPVMPPAPDSKK